MERLNEKGKSLFQALRYDRREWCEMGSGEKKKERNGKKEVMELSLSPYRPLCFPALFFFHCRHYLNSGNKVKKHRFLLLIIAELCTDHFLYYISLGRKSKELH